MKVRPERTAEQLQRWLQALANLGAAVNRGVSLSELLDLVAKTACELMSYDFCGINIPDPASQFLLIEGSYGLSADFIRHVNTTHAISLRGFPAAPSSRALALGVPVQIADIESDPLFGPWRDLARSQGFTSMIAVPLNASGQTLGTLVCYTRSHHHFNKGEESLLNMLANQAAIAVAAARLRSKQAKTIEALEEQYELRRQADAIHERLTALTLEGGGVAAIAEALAEILARPVAVSDASGAILHSIEYAGEALPRTLPADAAALSEDAPAAASGSPADLHLPSSAGTRSVMRVPVMIKDEVVAWIWTSGQLAELRPLDRQTIERTATVLALELLHTRTAAEAEWRDTGEVLSGLLSDRGYDPAALLARAARLGHDLSHPHAVVVAQCGLDNEGALPGWLTATFARRAEHVSPRPLLGSHEGYAVALWPLGSETPMDEVRVVGDEIRRSVEEHQNTDRVYVAITGPSGRMADYLAAFAAARGAIELATLRKGSSRTLLLTDLGLAGLLLQLPDVSALSRYVDEVLGPLRAHDEARAESLLPTLSALVRNNLNERDAARQLDVHEDIVMRRRREIEELLAVDLSRISDFAHISMALDVADVVEARRR